MKKTADKPHRVPGPDSLARYDWSKATRGRFAHLIGRPVHAVTIDADLYELFGSAEAINNALRAFVMMHEAAPKPHRAPKRPSKGRAA